MSSVYQYRKCYCCSLSPSHVPFHCGDVLSAYLPSGNSNLASGWYLAVPSAVNRVGSLTAVGVPSRCVRVFLGGYCQATLCRAAVAYKPNFQIFNNHSNENWSPGNLWVSRCSCFWVRLNWSYVSERFILSPVTSLCACPLPVLPPVSAVCLQSVGVFTSSPSWCEPRVFPSLSVVASNFARGGFCDTEMLMFNILDYQPVVLWLPAWCQTSTLQAIQGFPHGFLFFWSFVFFS